MSIPRVYAAINAVAGELSRSGIPKNQTNAAEDYQYRGIDDVMRRLSPILASHGLCVLPKVLGRKARERTSAQGDMLISVNVHVAFDFVSAEDGSSHTIETYGEALDGGDKATAKAMSAAFKQAILQAFCVPVTGAHEPDKDSFRLRARHHIPEPPQGWTQWSSEIREIVRVCETEEALDRVQSTHRASLKAFSAEQPELYADLGEVFQARRRAISAPPAPASAGARTNAPRAKAKRTTRLNGAETRA